MYKPTEQLIFIMKYGSARVCSIPTHYVPERFRMHLTSRHTNQNLVPSHACGCEWKIAQLFYHSVVFGGLFGQDTF